MERVHYYKFKWQHQQDRRKLGETYLFHPRWRIFVYKLSVGSSAITRPDFTTLISGSKQPLKGARAKCFICCIALIGCVNAVQRVLFGAK